MQKYGMVVEDGTLLIVQVYISKNKFNTWAGLESENGHDIYQLIRVDFCFQLGHIQVLCWGCQSLLCLTRTPEDEATPMGTS